jgi:hypothetical protein
MSKRFLLYLLACVSIAATAADLTESTMLIPRSRILSSNMKEGTHLFYNKNGFFVHDEDGVKEIPSYDTAQLFRNRPVEDIARYTVMNKFALNRMSDGEYRISTHGELKGGGFLGACFGAFIGKAVVSLIGHGTIALISIGATAVTFNPGVGWLTAGALESWLCPAIEAASIKGAIGGGILGGTITGPV